MEYTLNVSLEELYFGVTKKIKINLTDDTFKILTIEIPRGYTKDTIKQNIKMNNTDEPIDLTITIKHKEHPIYNIVGKNLVCSFPLTYYQIIYGFDFKLKHLNDQILDVKHNSTFRMENNQLIYNNLGMPYYDNNKELCYGKLIIQFYLVIPNKEQVNSSFYKDFKETMEKEHLFLINVDHNSLKKD